MKITQEFLLDLQDKARNATQGKWKVQTNAPLVVANDEQTFIVKVAHKWGNLDQEIKDAEYIAAANPQTVLELIARIERLEEDFEAAAKSAADEIINDLRNEGGMGTNE